jgi:hypothetical protein
MNKYARQIGVTRAFLDHGYTPGAIKLAYMRVGVSEKIAEAMVKEAALPWAWLSKLVAGGAQGLRGAFGAGAKAGPAAGYVTKGLVGEGGPFAQWLGKGLHGAATGLRSGLQSFEKNPWSSLGRGALETGKGALFFGGKGIGGTLGKGIGGYQMANLLFGNRNQGAE